MSKQLRIPPHLKDKTLRDAVNVGLHYLYLGHRPETPAKEGQRVTQRIPLSERGAAYLNELLQCNEWDTPAEVVSEALQWLSEQPEYILKTKL